MFFPYYNINEIYLLAFPIAVLAELIVRIKILTTNKVQFKEILNFGVLLISCILVRFFSYIIKHNYQNIDGFNFNSATAADYFSASR